MPADDVREITFPDRVFVSERGSLTLRYAPNQAVAVVVNRLGNEILSRGCDGDTPGTLSSRIAADRPELAPLLEKVLEPFLAEVAATGYLSPPEPEPAPEPGPGGTVPLHHLYLHLTDACNLHCVYCYNAKQRRRGVTRPLGRDRLRILIEEAAAMGGQGVIFTGGEPLLRKGVCELAGLARELGLGTTLLTNGALVTDDRARRIAAVFDTVVVSLDSPVAAVQESLRPGAALGDVVRGIRHLVRHRVPSLALRPVITRTSLPSLPDLPGWAAVELGLNQFSPALYLPGGRDELESGDLLPDPGEYRRVRALFLEEVRRHSGTVIDECRPLELAGVCGAGGSVLSVAPDGDVYPCQCLHFDRHRLGSIRERSLRDVSRSSKSEDFRKATWPWLAGCESCLLVDRCTATCRIFEETFAGEDELFNEQMCPFFRWDIENRLWREAVTVSEGESC